MEEPTDRATGDEAPDVSRMVAAAARIRDRTVRGPAIPWPDLMVSVAEGVPAFDGDYLCAVEIPQPCGNTWTRFRVVHRRMASWEPAEGETVTHFAPTPLPM